jgi:putative transposase
VRLARENNWGYTRILGELRKLNVTKISRQTVKSILVKHGLNPGPRRGEGTWDEVLKMHSQTLWACNFFSKHVWTKAGLVESFVLLFIHVGTRRVQLTGMSARPNAAWIAEQASAVAAPFCAAVE